MICIEGTLVTDWHQLFIHSWLRYADTPPIAPPPIRQYPQDQLGRVVASDGRPHNTIRQTLLQHIQLADQRVWLATAYFAPSWRIRRHLRKAARRGVDVRLLLPGPLTDHPPVRHAGRRFYTRLLKHGVRIFEYQPRVFHAKVALCDHWISIGSSNFDHWGLRWNQEANQEVEDPDFAGQVADMLEEDFTECREYHYHAWCQRNWYARSRERFWGAVDQWLAAITNRLQRRRQPPK
jgi:phosphatidylserine/phosphatidylglycerophosphate/cardiolipin synthase-like enzyme